MIGAEFGTPDPGPEGGARLAVLCHELRTYLAASLTLVEALECGPEHDSPHRAPLSLVREQLTTMSSIVAAELDNARQQSRPIDLADLVARCARTAEAADGVHVHLEVRERPTVFGRQPQLRRAVLNLIENACRASEVGTVHIEVTERGAEAYVIIEDDGPGFGRIPRGTGQGLEQVRTAALAHGGNLDIAEASRGGTRACLSLPHPSARNAS